MSERGHSLPPPTESTRDTEVLGAIALTLEAAADDHAAIVVIRELMSKAVKRRPLPEDNASAYRLLSAVKASEAEWKVKA